MNHAVGCQLGMDFVHKKPRIDNVLKHLRKAYDVKTPVALKVKEVVSLDGYRSSPPGNFYATIVDVNALVLNAQTGKMRSKVGCAAPYLKQSITGSSQVALIDRVSFRGHLPPAIPHRIGRNGVQHSLGISFIGLDRMG
jgi:hypothetical protein